MLYCTKVKTLHYNIIYFVRNYRTKLKCNCTKLSLFMSELCSFLCLKLYSCMGIRYAKLFQASKSMFKACYFHVLFEHGFYLKKLNWALICMHDVTLESVVAVTDYFANAFVRENVARVYMTLWRRNDVRKFHADAILFLEIKCKKRDI